MSSNVHSFPSRLTYLREKRRMSKTALGKAVGVSTTCVWNWEEGNTVPRSENLTSLSRVLTVPTDYLEYGRGDEGAFESGNIIQPTHSELSLSSVINDAKTLIAKLAGIDPSKVKISLDY